jgi:four helix bundle protein
MAMNSDSSTTFHRGADIQRRTFLFAARVLKMVQSLPKDSSGQIVARQLARSGTSVGANVEEAQGALSRTDFTRRITIALSEAREVRYWLRLVAEVGMLPARRVESITQESDELVKILSTIVRKSRGNKGTGAKTS